MADLKALQKAVARVMMLVDWMELLMVEIMAHYWVVL